MNKFQKILNLAIVGIFAVTILFASAQPVAAYESDEDGRVASDEIINDDLLLSGDKVVMNGKIMGTLIAAGQDVTINGTVEGDAFVFAQTITIGQGAQIKGNLFTGAQVVEVSGKVMGSLFSGSMSTDLKDTTVVTRNVYFGGYSLTIAENAQIGRDLAAGSYQVVLDGKVARDVNADSAAFQLNGNVGRNFDVNVAEPSTETGAPPTVYMPNGANAPETLNPGLVISESAVIGGNLAYTSPIPQDDAIAAQPGGEVIYRTPVPSQEDQPAGQGSTRTSGFGAFFKEGIGKTIVDTLKAFISIFLIGALAIWLLPRRVDDLTALIMQKPLPSAGYGSLVFIVAWAVFGVAAIVIILAAFLLGLVSLGGLGGITFWTGTTVWLAAFTGFIFMITLGCKVLLAYLIGDWVLSSIFKQSQTNRYLVLLLGTVIFVILQAIPILGWLFGLAVTLLGLGALWLYIQSLRKPAAAPVVAA